MRWSSTRETIELAFLAAMQVLPPRQRAALIARDVLGWPAAETAIAARDQRGRREQRAAAGPGDDAGAPAGAARRLVGRRAERRGARPARTGSSTPTSACDAAAGRGDRRAGPPDHDAAAADAASTGVESIAPLLDRAFGDRDGDWRLVPTLRQPDADSGELPAPAGRHEFRAFKLDVLRVEDGRIAEITTFGAALFPAFGLAPTL